MTRLKYWLEHPTKKVWIGPFKDINNVRREAKHIAFETGKAVEVFSEDGSTGATKAVERLRKATSTRARK